MGTSVSDDSLMQKAIEKIESLEAQLREAEAYIDDQHRIVKYLREQLDLSTSLVRRLEERNDA
jgi:hypothetical protein